MSETFTSYEESESEDVKKENANEIEVSKEEVRIIEQLHTPERLQIGEDEITIYDAVPQAETLKSKVPVIFGAGLLQDGEKQRELMFQLAKYGRRSLSFSTVHGVEKHDIDSERTKDFPEAEVRKMAALLAIIDHKDIEKIDYVGHSEGGIYGLLAAVAFPEKFRSIIVDSPVIIKEDDTPLKLIKRFTTDLASGIIQDMKKNKPDWVEKIGQKPGVAGDVYDSAWSKSIQEMRKQTGTDREFSEHKQSLSPKKLWEEVKAIANIKMEELLPYLKEQGVNVVISYGVDDKTTPGERIQGTIKAKDVAGVYSMHGGHSTIYWAPEKYAHLIDHTFSALEKKQCAKI